MQLGFGEASATAYAPLYGRWVMHKSGMRLDEACDRIFQALPAASPQLVRLVSTPPLFALRQRGLRKLFAAYARRRPSSPGTFMYQRTDFFDAALRDYLGQVAQIVFLGAGWDTRAFNLPSDLDVRVFEVDRAQTQVVKRAALREAGVDEGRVVFVSADFNQESWLDALTRSGFDPSQPTFFLWEGVTYYLTEAAIHATLDAVANQCAAGSVIAFDYPSRELINADAPLPIRAALKYLERSGEPWTYGISTKAPARANVATLVESRGLQLLRFEPCGADNAVVSPFAGLALAGHV